ncbi:MAG: metal ABC transporter substrate-binding protein [Acidimicrobiia bacterium]|nr:metal ABC transporter substrate-binding protein [Acidimicrobiia bacterium]
MILILVNRLRSTTAVLLALVLVVPGCAGAASDPRPTVVVSTSILGDLVARTVGDLPVDLHVIIPNGVSPHDYSPSARQIAMLTGADLVVLNGLGLEQELGDIASTQASGRVVELAPLLDPLLLANSSAPDPHIWMDPIRMLDAVGVLVTELSLLLPGQSDDIRINGDRLQADILGLDRTIMSMVDGLDPEDRKLVTNHDALGYFAARYGFEVIGSVLPGDLGNPSPEDLARLSDRVAELGVPAIFTEVTEQDDITRLIAADLGIPVVAIDTGALGAPGSGADSYVGMMAENTRLIVEGLAP